MWNLLGLDTGIAFLVKMSKGIVMCPKMASFSWHDTNQFSTAKYGEKTFEYSLTILHIKMHIDKLGNKMSWLCERVEYNW